MSEKGKIILELSNKTYILNLAFLTDITTLLNGFYSKLQGKDKLLSNMYAGITVFKIKLKLLHKHVNEQRLNHFVCCDIVIGLSESTLCLETVNNYFLNKIENLQNEFLTFIYMKKKNQVVSKFFFY